MSFGPEVVGGHQQINSSFDYKTISRLWIWAARWNSRSDTKILLQVTVCSRSDPALHDFVRHVQQCYEYYRVLLPFNLHIASSGPWELVFLWYKFFSHCLTLLPYVRAFILLLLPSTIGIKGSATSHSEYTCPISLLCLWLFVCFTIGTRTSNTAQSASVKFLFARTWPSQVSGRQAVVSAEYRWDMYL